VNEAANAEGDDKFAIAMSNVTTTIGSLKYFAKIFSFKELAQLVLCKPKMTCDQTG